MVLRVIRLVLRMGTIKEGSRGWLYFGKNKVCRDRFHREIKEDIFKNAGDFKTKVGKNPDVEIINGKIRLKGYEDKILSPFKRTDRIRSFIYNEK